MASQLAGVGLQAQQWQCAFRPTHPCFAVAGCPGSSSVPLVSQDPFQRQQSQNSFKENLTPRSGARPYSGAATHGGTPRFISRPIAKETSCSSARAIDVNVLTSASQNSLKENLAPQSGARTYIAATPHGGTPRFLSRPIANETSYPSSEGIDVNVLTSASQNTLREHLSPRSGASPYGGAKSYSGTARFISHSITIPPNSGDSTAPRPQSIGESGLLTASSGRLRFDAPQASPLVSARGFPCQPSFLTNGTRIAFEREVIETPRMSQHAPPVRLKSYEQVGRSSFSSLSNCAVAIHERVCKTPRTPTRPPPENQVPGGASGHRNSVGVATSPIVSSTAPLCSHDLYSQFSGALLSHVVLDSGVLLSHVDLDATQPDALRQSSQMSEKRALDSCSILNNSSCSSPPDARRLVSCPALHLEEGALPTSEHASSASSTGAQPTPSPEDVPPWRSNCHSAKQETHPESTRSAAVANEDNADCNPGLLTDIGWTPSFHFLAVAPPGVDSTSPPVSTAIAPVDLSQNLRQPSTASEGPSLEEEMAQAMVMDIEAEAAHTISERYAASEPPKSFVMAWDVEDTPPSAEKASGSRSEADLHRALEELKSAVTLEAAERRRLEVLQSRADDHIADCERRIEALQGSLVEANCQRDDFQRQMKGNSEKHLEHVMQQNAEIQANQEADAAQGALEYLGDVGSVEATNVETKPPHLVGNGSWASSKESTALFTEEEEEQELPTTEEQLWGEWSSDSPHLRESLRDPGSEELVLPRSVTRSTTDSAVECSRAANIGPPYPGASPLEIDERDGNVSLSACQTSEANSITSVLISTDLSNLREPAASPKGQSDDSFLTIEASRSARTNCCNKDQFALSLRDLSEIKALKKPPPPIRMLMEVCCVLFHIQPVKHVDDRNAKKYKLDYWEPARRYLLSDPFFLSKLRTYEPDEISSTQRTKINKYFQDPEFTAERLKSCSKAASELYEWVSRLTQAEVPCNVSETRQKLPMGGSSRRRELPHCVQTPRSTSASVSSKKLFVV